MSHPPSAEGVVLVDFDGTIFPWGALEEIGEPLPGAREGMAMLEVAGYRIVIFTSRLSPTWHRAEGRDPAVGIPHQRAVIKAALMAYGIPFDDITAEKIPAELYLDDKAMRVTPRRHLAKAVDTFLLIGDLAV